MIRETLMKTCDDLRDSILSPAGIECADTTDSDHTLREDWKQLVSSSVEGKMNSPSNKKISFLESLQKDFQDFDQNGVPSRHANGELVSKSLRKKIKKKLNRRRKD